MNPPATSEFGLKQAFWEVFTAVRRTKLRFLLRQGFGGQDGGQESYEWQEGSKGSQGQDFTIRVRCFI